MNKRPTSISIASHPDESCFLRFQSDVDHIPLPDKFTFPFYYEPHPLCIIAVKELQEYLATQKDWDHNFGLDESKEGLSIGKMFGVLITKNQNNEIGYLTAFSGKLANKNSHPRFVPPIYDMLEEDGYFLKSIPEINALNAEIKTLENRPEYLQCLADLEQLKLEAAHKIAAAKEQKRIDKAERKAKRAAAKDSISPSEYEALLQSLGKESILSKVYVKQVETQYKDKISVLESQLEKYNQETSTAKQKRKERSSQLQQWLFDQYQFLNVNQEVKSLCDIFEQTTTKVPPAGSGECAAPKLLQYAFRHKMQPIAMAEFWWGESLSEVRVHGHYYPACHGKCGPILGHMLQGMITDPNPMLLNGGEGKEIKIIYEDDALAIINKPPELLSVPGKVVYDSVQERMKIRYPDADCSLVVHRLDMSTSGLMIIPKTQKAFKYIQRQFIKRRIKKKYVALLDGILDQKKGTIELPLRLDIDDRPRQLVDHELGKSAITEWEVVSASDHQTRVNFYPLTGRTHQLRVHAAHALGLKTPIVGDDLYGQISSRLMLHAETISFIHPSTREEVTFSVDPEF